MRKIILFILFGAAGSLQATSSSLCQEVFDIILPGYVPEAFDKEAAVLYGEYERLLHVTRRTKLSQPKHLDRVTAFTKKLQRYLEEHGVRFTAIPSDEGPNILFIEPGDESSLNRYALLIETRYGHQTFIDLVKAIRRRAKAFFSIARAEGGVGMSLASALDLVVNEAEGHETVHVDTQAELESGNATPFHGSIESVEPVALNHFYDQYLSLDEFLAYAVTLRLIHDLHQQKRPVRGRVPSVAKTLQRIDRLAAYVGRLADNTQKTTNRLLVLAQNGGGNADFNSFTLENGREMLVISVADQINRLEIQTTDPKLLAISNLHQRLDIETSNFAKKLISREKGNGNLSSDSSIIYRVALTSGDRIRIMGTDGSTIYLSADSSTDARALSRVLKARRGNDTGPILKYLIETMMQQEAIWVETKSRTEEISQFAKIHDVRGTRHSIDELSNYLFGILHANKQP